MLLNVSTYISIRQKLFILLKETFISLIALPIDSHSAKRQIPAPPSFPYARKT
ncbi:hypothetical protein M090_4152 [Parabacteroides distasonis str. 3776 Po2 i]|uniref:Uncharacterized protein n=1 Tax=Parabacteroides distasonis str. 3776 D15 i TaxID=1339342 RepID=A0AB34L2Z6_PARDI|nr:hypothetical protein M091_2895 [Parabacteroides distasonis str. 3776 D15 i]KDS45685.1 hypothetical protein M090_4152 [Parabacteroides distasonis str. 3776 Po2 i]